MASLITRVPVLSPRLWPRGAVVSTDGDVLFDGLEITLRWGPVTASAFVPGRLLREAYYYAAVWDDVTQHRAVEAFVSARIAREVGAAGLSSLGEAALAAAGIEAHGERGRWAEVEHG